jgi:uncharacterized membrane protein YfhO
MCRCEEPRAELGAGVLAWMSILILSLETCMCYWWQAWFLVHCTILLTQDFYFAFK